MGGNGSFGMQPEVMPVITAAQQGASALITSAYSAVTPTELAGFATALGPIAAGNMTPAFFEATGNNVTTGMLTAANHAIQGAATDTAASTYTNVDQDFDFGGHGRSGDGLPAGQDAGPGDGGDAPSGDDVALNV